jgi:hypothetical protein
MTKYTIEEFADKIRRKYPNAYDDLSDNELVRLWLEKYPNDRKHILSNAEQLDLDDEEYEEEEESLSMNSNENSNSLTWLLVIVSAAVLFFTNPSLEKHKNVSANDMMSILKESKTYDLMNTFYFGKGEDLLISSIKGGIHRSNYFLFSLTTIYISDDKDTEVIGIGILGMVFIFDDAKQELKSKIKSYDSAAGLFFGS